MSSSIINADQTFLSWGFVEKMKNVTKVSVELNGVSDVNKFEIFETFQSN